MTLASSHSTFLVTPGATATASLTLGSLTRQNNSTVAFRGAGLGGTPGNTVSNIYATAAPALTGGGGGTGSTAISILPYAYGNNTNSVLFTAPGLVGSSLVTYGANGFRPLDPTTEYATGFGVSNLDNVRLTRCYRRRHGCHGQFGALRPGCRRHALGGSITSRVGHSSTRQRPMPLARSAPG